MIIVLIIVIGSFIWSSILVIIVLIICWPKARLFVQSVFLWTWIHRASHPGNGQNRKDAARLLGVAVAPLRVCAFPSGKGWYHGVEPRYLLMLKTLYLLWCDVGYRALGWKGPKGPGNGVLVSVVTQLRGNPALCWQSSGLVLGDVFPKAFSCGNGKFLGLTMCWKSKETIRDLYGFSCRTCHLIW